MRIQNVLLTLLGVFGFSIGGGVTGSYTAQAHVQQCKANITGAMNGLTEEECCQLALEENSIEALENFLRLYPPGRSDSACSALAMTALSGLGSGGGIYGS